MSRKTKTLHTDALEARHCTANQIRLAARQITRYLDAKMRRIGLRIEQFNLLTEIAARKDDSVAAIAASACLDKSTLSRNLKALERDGFIAIATSGTSSRRRVVWLTEKGARKLEDAIPLWRAASASLSRFVDRELAASIADSSRKIPIRHGGRAHGDARSTSKR